MINSSKTKLICSAVCAADSLSGILKVNVSVLNPYNTSACPSCGLCSAKHVCPDSTRCQEQLKAVTPLLQKLGRIIFFCPKGTIFTASPIFYADHTAALLIAGPLAGFLDSLKNTDGKRPHIPTISDCRNPWQISDTVLNLSKGFSSENNTASVFADYFKDFENRLVMLLRLKNLPEFKSETNRLLWDICLSLPNSFDSSKALVLTVFMLVLNICTNNGFDIKTVFGRNFELFSELRYSKYETQTESLLKSLFDGLALAVFGKASTRQLAINDAIEYIEHHFAEKLSLQSVAAAIYLSPHYLSKAFHEETGINFSNFLNKTRIEKAKIMITDTKTELDAIAVSVGFHDQSYFSKVFKKHTGMTPSEYKLKTNIML